MPIVAEFYVTWGLVAIDFFSMQACIPHSHNTKSCGPLLGRLNMHIVRSNAGNGSQSLCQFSFHRLY